MKSILSALAPITADEAAAVTSAVAATHPGRTGWKERVARSALAAYRAAALEAQNAALVVAQAAAAERFAKSSAEIEQLIESCTEGRPALQRVIEWKGGKYKIGVVKEILDVLHGLQITTDPGPGYWDKNFDFEAERWTPAEEGMDHRRFVVEGMKFRLRTDAASACPSGPCGTKLSLYRLR